MYDLSQHNYDQFTPPFSMTPANGGAGNVLYYRVHDVKGKLVAQGSQLLCLAVKDRGDELVGLRDKLDIPSFLHHKEKKTYPLSTRDADRNRIVEHDPVLNDMNTDPLAITEDSLALDDDPLAVAAPADPLALDEDPLA